MMGMANWTSTDAGLHLRLDDFATEAFIETNNDLHVPSSYLLRPYVHT
jgi:hypothetical protein